MSTYSNFRDVQEVGVGLNKIIYAKVDVTTGWFFKKTKTVDIYTEAASWRYLSTGAFTRDNYVENLYSKYKAEKQAFESSARAKKALSQS